MTFFLLNTTILTTPGLTYTSRYIGLVEAKSTLGVPTTDADSEVDRAAGRVPRTVITGGVPSIVSAIGHQATAEIASALLGLHVEVSRVAAQMVAGDSAICVKLRGRPTEGAILSRAEVEAIGYDLVLLEAQDPKQLRTAFRTIEVAAELLAYPDDVPGLPAPTGVENLAADSVALARGVQRPGTRRRGNYPAPVHFIVRYPASYGDGYVEVLLENGTEAWSVTDLTEPEAVARYAKR